MISAILFRPINAKKNDIDNIIKQNIIIIFVKNTAIPW